VSKRRKPREGAQERAEQKRQRVRDVFVPRPFAGLADEGDWVAMREIVPAASAPLRLTPELAAKHPDRSVILATVLPLAWPAMTKPDGRVLVGLQRHAQSGDASRDLAAALLCALDTKPGDQVSVPALPGPGPRLQDVLADAALEVTVHEGFDFWMDPEAADDPGVQSSLERANASVVPTVKLASVRAGYWCRVPDRAHVRWVLSDEEEPALAALARLAAAGALTLGDGTRFAGMFRACGLLIPVWDLPAEPPAADWEEPMHAFAKRYAEALASDADLTSAERRARQGLVGRQLTLR
jgi:hypothetical protein